MFGCCTAIARLLHGYLYAQRLSPFKFLQAAAEGTLVCTVYSYRLYTK